MLVNTVQNPEQPIGRPKKVFNRDEAIKLRQRGWSVRAIAKHLNIGLGTVVRALKSQQPLPSERVVAPILTTPKPHSEILEQ